MLKASIIGNLGADAQVNRGDFKEFVSMSVAHTFKYRDSNGTTIEQTTWAHVVINWNCANLMQYLVKGTKIYASGNIRLRTYKAQGGETRVSLDIIADTVELCGGSQPNTSLNPRQAETATPSISGEYDTK